MHRDLSEIFGVDGELGSVRTFRLNGLIGSFQAEANYRGATISASVARKIVAESAQSMRANLWQTEFDLDASYKFTERLSSELELHHKLYSDRNSSNELDWSPQYLFNPFGSKLAVGYHFSFVGFARNTNNGYWAPRLALSHNAFAHWSYDWTKVFSRLELELGRGSDRESSAEGTTHGYSTSVSAVLGLRPIENMVIEYSLSADRSPGWNSRSSALSVKYAF
jgi:hypothetical protein